MIATESIEVEIGNNETSRLYVSIETPTGTTAVRISALRLNGTGSTAGDTFVIDKCLIIKNPPENIDPETYFFDGDTPELSYLSFAWNGTDGESTSSMFRMTNPSMFKNSLRLSFQDPLGRDVFIDASPIRSVSYDRPIMQDFVLNFQIMLRSNFPFFISSEPLPIFFDGFLGINEKGFKLSTSLPLSLNQTFTQGAVILEVEEPSFAIIHMRGSDNGNIINPRVTNLTNGQSIMIRKGLLGANRFFLIDGVNQKMVDENNISITQYSDGEFIYLDRGENILVYTSDN